MVTPLEQLDYFTEWGGRAWVDLTRQAVDFLDHTGGIAGARLLEIGARYGKMSVFFALLGAEVTGIDLWDSSLQVARQEAEKWQASGVRFVQYDGDLDIFPDASFDMIFTKSVLVVVPELEAFLEKVDRKLAPGGRVVFLENGRGHPLMTLLRNLKHRRWDWHSAHYFEAAQVALVGRIFDLQEVHQTHLPPIYGLLGRKRA